jgi:hypothetical protein
MKSENNKTPKIKGLSEIFNISRYDGPCSEIVALQGKQPSETPAKILARSNDRIKSYSPFELLL